jgi:hypothetical protein
MPNTAIGGSARVVYDGPGEQWALTVEAATA